MSIKYLWTKNKALSYDPETKMVTLYGQPMSEEYFREVVVVTALNASGSNHGVSISILEAMHIAGMSTRGFGHYSEAFGNYLHENSQELAARQREARAHQERMAALHATPEEIEKAVNERKANVAAQVAQFRKSSAGF